MINLDYVPDEANDYSKIEMAFAMSRSLEALVHFVYPGMPLSFRFTELGATGWWNVFGQKDLASIYRTGSLNLAFGRFMSDAGKLSTQNAAFDLHTPDSAFPILTDERKAWFTGLQNRHYVYGRKGTDGQTSAIIIGNLSYRGPFDMEIPLPDDASGSAWRIAMSTDLVEYGGLGLNSSVEVQAGAVSEPFARILSPWKSDDASLYKAALRLNGAYVNSENKLVVKNLAPFETLILVRDDGPVD